MVLVQVPSNTYPAARRTFTDPGTLDPSWASVKLTLTRESWPDTGSEVVHFGAEVSLDGGQTWQFAGEAGARGGVFAPGGVERTTSSFTVGLPEVGTAGRRLRGYLENFVTLTTAVKVEAF